MDVLFAPSAFDDHLHGPEAGDALVADVTAGREALAKYPTVREGTKPLAVKTAAVFGYPPSSIRPPLNLKTTTNERRQVPVDGLEPSQPTMPVAGVSAYLEKPRRDPADIACVVMRDGRERYIIQEGHTRCAAAKLRGDATVDARVWSFQETASGGIEPVPRGLHKRGLVKSMLSHREWLALLLGDAPGLALAPEDAQDLSHRERLALLLGDFEGHPFRGNQHTGGDGEDRQAVGGPAPKYDPSKLTGHEAEIYGQTRSMAVTAAVSATASAFGFPINRVKADDMRKHGTFKLAGGKFFARGIFDPRTGQVEFDRNMSAVEATAVLAHEFSHDAYQQATKGDTQESKDFKEHVEVFASELRRDDGVTPYSEMYWRHAAAAPTASDAQRRTSLAVNETLAEISRLKVGGGHVSLETSDSAPTGGIKGTTVMPAAEVASRIRSSDPLKTHKGRAVSDTWHEAHNLLLKASDKAYGT